MITTKYINSHYCKSELYTANNDRKHIFPIIFEDVDFSSSSAAKGVKYILSGINWTMFRPSVDDYHTSLRKLIEGMKEQGKFPPLNTDLVLTMGLGTGKENKENNNLLFAVVCRLVLFS